MLNRGVDLTKSQAVTEQVAEDSGPPGLRDSGGRCFNVELHSYVLFNKTLLRLSNGMTWAEHVVQI
jgi:hypothetical protein